MHVGWGGKKRQYNRNTNSIIGSLPDPLLSMLAEEIHIGRQTDKLYIESSLCFFPAWTRDRTILLALSTIAKAERSHKGDSGDDERESWVQEAKAMARLCWVGVMAVLAGFPVAQAASGGGPAEGIRVPGRGGTMVLKVTDYDSA